MQYSSVVARLMQRGSNKPETHEFHGRIRLAIVDTTFTDDDSSVCLARFAAGRIRVLGMSVIGVQPPTKGKKDVENPESPAIRVGTSSYQNYQRLRVDENLSSLLSATPLKTAMSGVRLLGAGLSGLVVESTNGFDVIMASSAPLPKDSKITGVIYYVAD